MEFVVKEMYDCTSRCECREDRYAIQLGCAKGLKLMLCSRLARYDSAIRSATCTHALTGRFKTVHWAL